MKTRNILLCITLFFAFNLFLRGQNNGAVGINTSTPNANSVLDIVSGDNNKGIMIPRLTEVQRNAIAINNTLDDGLAIYNTTENCLNYWSNTDNEWKSVCGQLGKSTFTIDCSNVQVMGTYIQGVSQSISNYLNVTVNVTKRGKYTIKGITSNGYNFYAEGAFLSTGIQTVLVPGQGTPIAVQTDVIQMYANDVNTTCSPAITCTVLNPAATFSMSCGSAIVNGVYSVGTALTASNTITLPVNVTALGSYSINTNTVDGISFSASGNFSATGIQNITLQGKGTPTSTNTKALTISSNSQGTVSTSCSVNVIMTIPIKTIVHIGGGAFGYSAQAYASYNMINSTNNFGNATNSKVKSQGFTHINLGDAPSDAAILSAINNKPDIVIIGYPYGITANAAQYLTDYLNSKGVVIAFSEFAINNQNLLRTVFSDNSITNNTRNFAGAIYTFANINDEILNGPFGDVRGKFWGEDASLTSTAVNLPLGSITVYSGASAYNSTNVYSGEITAFKHNSLNLIWIGDAGFLSNQLLSGTFISNTIEPFATNSTNYPIAKAYGTAGGSLATAGGAQVTNSIIFANMMAWAIKQAEFNGINSQ